jgi:cobaltochelatase CobT
MPPESIPQDSFRRAVAAAARALAQQNDLKLDLPPPVPDESLQVARIRGNADAAAMKERFHDPAVHARMLPASEPARSILEAAERARIDAVGGNAYDGVRVNLDAELTRRYRDAGLDHIVARDDAPLAEVVRLVVREWLTGAPPPRPALMMIELWRPWFNTHARSELMEMTRQVEGQEAFAAQVLKLVARFPESAFEVPPVLEPKPHEHERGEDHSEDGESNGTETLIHHPKRRWETRPKLSLSDAKELEAESARYSVFTREFDEVVDAHRLTNPDDLLRLRRKLDALLRKFGGGIAQLANRLQRQLLARQSRSWMFDLEDGILDSGRLARVVATPHRPLSFKRERHSDFPDTVVSLLVDNSGSMRGVPITTAALCTDLLARTLERCGVKVEILGFTTKAWKGGESRRKWTDLGKPENPGRLNDLRHIIYKSASVPWRRARRRLGVMLHPDLLRENIDGEALLWSHSRLVARRETRRILMVISDGAPIDDSTISANDRSFLDRHLRSVIAAIEAYSPIELVAIGIGHDVTRYYRRSITIASPEELGAAMVEHLEELFLRQS